MLIRDEDGVIREEMVSIPFLRTPYNYDRDAASLQDVVDCSVMPSMTKQSFAEECDINTIVKNFGLTGELPKDLEVPLSGDFVDAVVDYHSAMNLIREADEAFMELPANVRARFDNDPQKLMEFVEDSKNLDEARKLGIAVPAPVPKEPMQVRVIPEAAEPPKTSST